MAGRPFGTDFWGLIALLRECHPEAAPVLPEVACSIIGANGRRRGTETGFDYL